MFPQKNGVFIEKTFKKAFILNEDSLSKIKSILEKRIKEDSKKGSKDKEKCDIIFSVKRDDGLMFSTSDIQKIIDENNCKTKQIREIKISVYTEDFFIPNKDIDIIFNEDSGVTVKIAGYDKDFVNLLYSDLEDYLSNSVLKFSRFRFKKRRIPFICSSLLIYSYYIIIKRSLARDSIEEVMSSDDIIEKMNFLLKIYKDNYGMGSGTLYEIFCIFAVLILALIIAYGYDYFYPKNIFYIGEGKNIYDKRVRLRKYIIGTILIGGILTGIIVSLLTDFFTKLISN